MLNFQLVQTGYEKQCILTGPMGDIVSVEFTNRTSAALFAQIKADGHPAVLWLVNERGGHAGCRDIPPPPGVEPKPIAEKNITPADRAPAYQHSPFSMLTLLRHEERKRGMQPQKNGSPRGPTMRS